MIYSIGEALVDVYESDLEKVIVPGGASANFCAAVAALGGSASIISALGDDEDGRYLMKKLKTAGINTDYVSVYPEYKTGRIVISPNGKGSALCLIRREAADMQLRVEDVPEKLFNSSDLLHFCSMSVIDSPGKKAFYKTLNAAVYAGSLLAFDINLRLKQWKSKEEFREAVKAILPSINYIKATRDELNFLFPNNAYIRVFKESPSLKYLIITSGAGLITAIFKDGYEITVKPFSEKFTERAGAGDCFYGAFILNMERLDSLKEETQERYKLCVKESLLFAAIAAESSIKSLNDFYAPSLIEIKKRLQDMQPK